MFDEAKFTQAAHFGSIAHEYYFGG
jgi:hypothetical protein